MMKFLNFVFLGYANEDFVGIPYPALKDYSPVTPEQAYLTLGYFRKFLTLLIEVMMPVNGHNFLEAKSFLYLVIF